MRRFFGTNRIELLRQNHKRVAEKRDRDTQRFVRLEPT